MNSFETKIFPRIGDPESGGQTDAEQHLHRTIRWSKASYTWEADSECSTTRVKDLGLEGGKSAETEASSKNPEAGRYAST